LKSFFKDSIPKPIKRSKVRRALGKKFYILKRKIHWLRNRKQYSNTFSNTLFENKIFTHKSFLLRPLKDVEMQYQHNKIKNLKLAIEKINKMIIKPGETFSLWYLVGKPSKNNGYLKGLVLNQGRIEYDYGGGLCQLGNLLYWMVLHTPLTVVERYRHGFDVFPDVNRKLPFGSGATLSYNYIDLQFKNETDNDFQLNLFLDETHLNGQIRCDSSIDKKYEVYEAEHLFSQATWGGYIRHNQIRRQIIKNNIEVGDEHITENHAIMIYEPFLGNTN